MTMGKRNFKARLHGNRQKRNGQMQTQPKALPAILASYGLELRMRDKTVSVGRFLLHQCCGKYGNRRSEDRKLKSRLVLPFRNESSVYLRMRTPVCSITNGLQNMQAVCYLMVTYWARAGYCRDHLQKGCQFY